MDVEDSKQHCSDCSDKEDRVGAEQVFPGLCGLCLYTGLPNSGKIGHRSGDTQQKNRCQDVQVKNHGGAAPDCQLSCYKGCDCIGKGSESPGYAEINLFLSILIMKAGGVHHRHHQHGEQNKKGKYDTCGKGTAWKKKDDGEDNL